MGGRYFDAGADLFLQYRCTDVEQLKMLLLHLATTPGNGVIT